MRDFLKGNVYGSFVLRNNKFLFQRSIKIAVEDKPTHNYYKQLFQFIFPFKRLYHAPEYSSDGKYKSEKNKRDKNKKFIYLFRLLLYLQTQMLQTARKNNLK